MNTGAVQATRQDSPRSERELTVSAAKQRQKNQQDERRNDDDEADDGGMRLTI